LDNVIANNPEVFQPGRVVNYNGMGMDLAGKVMEIVSGKSYFRLAHENFFRPLGLSNEITQRDLAFGIDCAVMDLARVGQMMLNRGSYGDTEFFSPETFAKLLPRPINEIYPNMPNSYSTGPTWIYGLGLMPMHWGILGRNTFGHGGAGGEILSVDPDNDLVVAMERFTQGKDFDKHLRLFLKSIAESMKPETVRGGIDVGVRLK